MCEKNQPHYEPMHLDNVSIAVYTLVGCVVQRLNTIHDIIQ